MASPPATRARRRGALLRLASGAGLVACSLLAPSDAELLGSGGGAGSSAGGRALTDGAAVGVGGSGGGGGAAPAASASPEPSLGGSSSSPDAAASLPAPPDAGLDEPSPCVDCESIRLTGGVETVRLGTAGGSLHMDICPHDRVVVGLDYTYDFGIPADFGYFTSVAVVCGELLPNPRAGSLRVIGGEPQPARGGGSGVIGTGGRCPLGQVVTGFEGARNFDGVTSELRELTLHCAPVAREPGASLSVGRAAPAQPLSALYALSTLLADEVLPLQSCPAGQVVRGAVVRAGQWVDGISFVCGTPVLALPDGGICGSAIECQSGSCNGSCQPRPCDAPEGCTCALLEDTQYAFCATALAQAAAAERCAASGMHLAHARDAIAHGWLRSSAGQAGVVAAFWLGADDLASEGAWQWVQGGGAVDLGSELWSESGVPGGALENCLEMTPDGHWDDVDCGLTLPFVCEAPSP